MAFARSREPGPLSLLYRPVVKLSIAARRSQFSMVLYLERRLEFHQNMLGSPSNQIYDLYDCPRRRPPQDISPLCFSNHPDTNKTSNAPQKAIGPIHLSAGQNAAATPAQRGTA